MDSNIQEDKNLYDDESIYFDLSEWISFFWSNKLVFIKVMTGALILGVIIALILPKKYTAIATILPPSSSSDISSRIRQITGSFSSGSSEIRLFPAIAKSRTVLEEVLKVNHNGKSFLNIIKKEHGVNLKDNDRIVKENILNFLKEQIDTQIDELILEGKEREAKRLAKSSGRYKTVKGINDRIRRIKGGIFYEVE